MTTLPGAAEYEKFGRSPGWRGSVEPAGANAQLFTTAPGGAFSAPGAGGDVVVVVLFDRAHVGDAVSVITAATATTAMRVRRQSRMRGSSFG
ncbi:MAG: hypothetical protein JO087_05855 [Actinobacteria bacterium]|nr:hypothetical protein [Actinomycetota bacterium]